MPSTDSLSNSGNSSSGAERRQHRRQVPNSLAYVHLDETNGGILINLSEGGLAVQAAMSVVEDKIPRVRLQAPGSTTWLETGARVAWSSDSRRMVGLQFVDAPHGFEDGIRNWLAAENTASQATPDAHPSAPSTLDAEPIALPPACEEIRPRGGRYPSMARAAQRDKDFDLAALLTSSESAKAVSRSPERQDFSHASATRLPVESKFDDEGEKQTKKGSGARYIPVLIVLAALSLIAGWEVGRGSAIDALFQSSAAAPPSGPNAAMLSLAATSAAVNFEVVDANNQSWLVPYAGLTSVPQNTPLVVIPPRMVLPGESAHAPATQRFNVPPLTAPRSVARAHNIQASAAPSLPDIQGNTSLPASVADTGTRVNVAPPPVAAAPAPSYSALVPAKLAKRIDPTYPKEAVDQRIEGTVKLHARISQSGSVSNVTALSGSRLLEPAAISAVSKWQYTPEMLDGHPVASEIDISIVFSLPH
jgi:TonB family protein